MDVRWVSDADSEAPPFDNHASPYAHYWLSTLRDEGGTGRRSAVEQTTRLGAGTQDLIRRAFSR